MFGRQDENDDNTTQGLDDQHAAYVTDLTSTSDAATGDASSIASAPMVSDASSSVVVDPPSYTPSTVAPAAAPTSPDELLDIKHAALNELSPLVGHLEQSPEEKFKTTMMLIQASDNSSLIKEAYEAAKQISDDKIRAQALLDVVNEINYFTRQTPTPAN